MPDYQKIVEGFARLLHDLGADAEQYINIDRFWEHEGLLDAKRRSIEKHIHQQYLPGFTFESNAHFRWHFIKRDDPFLALRGRLPDTYFNRWIRAIMVPSALHYRAEIALAIKSAESGNRKRLESAGKWDKTWSWVNRVRWVIARGPAIGDHPDHSNVDDGSIFRWARDAAKHRQERKNGQPPSAWKISAISLPGDLEADWRLRDEHSWVSRDEAELSDYRETWSWKRASENDPPFSDEITFTTPAAASIWQKDWKSKKPDRPGLRG